MRQRARGEDAPVEPTEEFDEFSPRKIDRWIAEGEKMRARGFLTERHLDASERAEGIGIVRARTRRAGSREGEVGGVAGGDRGRPPGVFSR